jgi:N-carbamoyl-L-amino-acid hydrolase
VGRLLVSPGAPNVIPGEVKLTVELRDLDMAKVESLWSAILAEGRRLAERHGVALEFVRRYASTSALTEPRLRTVIAEAARGLGLGTLELPSGAGHDAQELARIAPVGMIFVPSVGGISHSPREFTRPEDVENGANVLLQSLLRLDRD